MRPAEIELEERVLDCRERCIAAGLVGGEAFSIDASLIKAGAEEGMDAGLGRRQGVVCHHMQCGAGWDLRRRTLQRFVS